MTDRGASDRSLGKVMKRTQTVEEMYYPQVSYIPKVMIVSIAAAHLTFLLNGTLAIIH